MEKESGKAFDLYLFKRVLAFTRPYPWTFLGTAVAAILLTIFSILTPLILKEIIDVAITQKQRDLLMTLSLAMVGVLIGQVVCQLLFTYYANWLGESVIM
ncbi:MAG: ABC transporter transmembrane domain-containing protein, partial [Robiginitalea sp.]